MKKVTVQAALLFGLICFLSYKILPKTDLRPFVFENFSKEILLPGIIAGIAVGMAIFLLDKWIFNSSMLSGVHPPFWMGLIASLYGAINEEILLRLFLLTFIYFLIGKCIKVTPSNRTLYLWVINIFVALLFGMGHLPAAFKLIEPSVFEVFRVLLLNGIAGVVFGYLFFSRNLWAAMLAHFVTDILIHALLR